MTFFSFPILNPFKIFFYVGKYRSENEEIKLILPTGHVIFKNVNPIPVVFLHNSKSIGLRLLEFSDFSYIHIALHLGLKLGFYNNCLSPQTYCMNNNFFLLQTKSLLWPTFSCYILIFLAVWKAYDIRKRIAQVLQRNFRKLCI